MKLLVLKMKKGIATVTFDWCKRSVVHSFDIETDFDADVIWTAHEEICPRKTDIILSKEDYRIEDEKKLLAERNDK